MPMYADAVPDHYMCCICYEYIPIKDLYVDKNGDKHDVCKPCAPKAWGYEP